MSRFSHPEDDNLATEVDACREFAVNVGARHPDTAWILSPFDTWERNPFYRGPAIPHPEDEKAYVPDESIYDPTIDAFVD